MSAMSESPSLSTITDAYAQSLSNRSVSATADLEKCGKHILRALRRASRALKEAEGALDLVVAQIKTLLHLADDHINSVEFAKVARHWLQLHTDTSLLLGLLGLHTVSEASAVSSGRKSWLRIIQRLDKAIIISGAIGENRSECVQACIRLAQDQLPSLSASSSLEDGGRQEDGRKPKRRRSDPPEPKTHSMFSRKSIPVRSSFPSMEEYRTSACRSPIILRGALLSEDGPCPPWRATNKWSSAEYLLDLVGEGRVVPVEIGSSYDESGWTQAIVPFRSFLHRAGFDVQVDQEEEESSPAPDGPWYLAQYELCRQFPGLEADFTLPDYVWSEPDWGSEYPKRLKDPAVNIWFGPGGGQVTTPAHTDPHFNCFAQVLGRKRVWVASPDSSPNMSAHGKTSDPSTASEYMTNTSTVPIFRSHATEARLLSDYPAFCGHVRPKAMEAYLDPGDLLLLPPGWWHAMQGVGDGPGCSVSIWF